MIAALDSNGHTYRSDGSIYFKISTLPGYGKLARLDHEGMKPGARVDSDSYAKEDARDFVLWKATKPTASRRGTSVGSAGPSRLAPRVLGDGAAAARRAADRHPRRRHRSDLPASRERDRAERGRDRQAVLALLGARRVPDRRRAEDVEVARQHLHDSRRRRERLPAVGGAVSAAVGALPQAAQLHVGEPGAGRGGAAAADRFPRAPRRRHAPRARTRRSPRASTRRGRRSPTRCRTT